MHQSKPPKLKPPWRAIDHPIIDRDPIPVADDRIPPAVDHPATLLRRESGQRRPRMHPASIRI